jgi:ATP-binding cassette subfamily F protein 3
MIEFVKVSKYFGSQEILNNVSFMISPGDRAGIVGPNGTGKSTIFRLIADEMSTDGGTISLPKNCRLGYLRQELSGNDDHLGLLEYCESGFPEVVQIQHRMEVLESQLHAGGGDRDLILKQLGELQTRFEDLHGYDIRNKAESALSALGFATDDFGKTLKEFSGGWQMRAELVRATVANPEVLLMDEPSNYLDLPAVEWLRRFMREFHGTLVLVSHDRYLLNSLTNVTLEVANAQVTKYRGNYDYYCKERVARVEERMAAHKNQERKRQQAERVINKFRSKSTKAALVQSMIKKVEKMEKIVVPVSAKSVGRIRMATPTRTGNEVVRLEDVSFTYDNDKWIFKDVNFSINRGDKVALVGLNGMGKTTLLKILAGKLEPTKGKMVHGHKVVSGYQSQEMADTMDDSLTVFQTVRQESADVSEQKLRGILGGFGFSGETVEKTVGVLSGGEKIRLAFARLLINPPNFLLLDEPTTHLDIAARETLEQALHDFEGTVCLVSHDVEFVRNAASTVIAMTPPGVTGYPGGYDYYREKVKEQEMSAESAQGMPVKKISDKKLSKRERAKKVQEFSRKKREIERPMKKAEKAIAELEAEQVDLLAQLGPDNHNVDHASVNKRLTEIQDKLNFANRSWEACMIEMDELEQEAKADNG